MHTDLSQLEYAWRNILRGCVASVGASAYRGKTRDAHTRSYIAGACKGVDAVLEPGMFDDERMLIERRGWREVQTQLHILEGKA